MAIAARIEIDVSSVISDPSVSSYPTANLTKGMFSGGRLGLPQGPGWYVPEPVVFEPVVMRGAAAADVIQGDRYYGFTAKGEAYRSHEIYKILSLLPDVVTLRDYCYLGSAGTPVVDGHGHYYVVRTGRLTPSLPQNPGRVFASRTVYFETMDLRFEQT